MHRFLMFHCLNTLYTSPRGIASIGSRARSLKITTGFFGCIVALAATISSTMGSPADSQDRYSGPNPFALALANAERAQEPRYRFIYNDDAEIDGLSEFMRFLLYADDFADSLQGIVYTISL
jgi:hypothetical protein